MFQNASTVGKKTHVSITSLLLILNSVFFSHALQPWSFRVTWDGEGFIEHSYPFSIFGDCVYDVTAKLLTCTHDHNFGEVTSRWVHEPELIDYVSVRCLAQTSHPSHKNVCFCKTADDDSSISRSNNKKNIDNNDNNSNTNNGNAATNNKSRATSLPNLRGHGHEEHINAPKSLKEVRQTESSTPESFDLCQLTRVTPFMLKGLSGLIVLDLSHNRISDLDPESFSQLHSLTALSLKHNPLTTISDRRVCLPPHLEVLDLSQSELSTFPVRFLRPCNHQLLSQQISLKYLDISGAKLTSIPPNAFWTTADLRVVNASHNSIFKLEPNPFIGAFNLTGIDLSHNYLQYIPVTFCEGILKLVSLFLSNNGFLSFDFESLRQCSMLEKLDFSSNGISIVNGLPIPLPRLKVLNISGNSLTELNVTLFAHNSVVEIVDVRSNGIQVISAEVFENAGKLKTLIMADNKLSDSHVSLRNITRWCRQLLMLDVSHNLIVSLDHGFLSHLSSLVELNLSFNKISTIDHGAFSGMNSLKKLELSNNFITVVDPSTFSPLVSLGHLNLSQNSLQGVKDVMLPLTLVNLDLSRNQFSSVPRLNKSHVLRVSLASNVISSLEPRDLYSMAEAQFLDLSRNAISELPSNTFEALAALKHLDLSGNEIQVLPVELIHNLTQLLYLKISNNFLTSISGLQLPRSLKTIDFSRNRIKYVTSPLNAKNVTSLRLTKVLLRNNRILHVDSKVFENLIYLREVDLRDNLLTHVAPFEAHPGITFFLQNNPIECSCLMEWIKDQDWVPNLSVESYYVIERCAVPPRYHQASLATVATEEFLCPVSTSCPIKCSCFAPEIGGVPLITMCASRNLTSLPAEIFNESKFISFEGNNLGFLEKIGSEKMAATDLYLNDSSIYTMNASAFMYFPFLTTLDLSHNFISHIDQDLFEPIKNLTHLHLASNRISSLSVGTFDHLQQLQVLDLSLNDLAFMPQLLITVLQNIPPLQYISLTGNPWICSCQNEAFVLWIKEQEKLSQNLGAAQGEGEGSRERECRERVTVGKSDNDVGCLNYFLQLSSVGALFCNNDRTSKVSDLELESLDCDDSELRHKATILIVCVFAVTILCFIILCGYHRSLIAAVLYSKFHCVFLKRTSSQRHELPLFGSYDITLIYDHHDRKLQWWVESMLLPKLQHPRWRFAVKCPVSEAAGLGSGSQDLCVHNVKQSRCSLVIASSYFSGNRQGVACFQEALQLRRTGLHTVVLITWGELTRDTLDCGVRLFIDKRLNLPITSHLFWTRLFYELPLPRHLVQPKGTSIFKLFGSPEKPKTSAAASSDPGKVSCIT